MSNSINTNSGTLVALRSLNRTNTALNVVQKRISTGFNIADATDNGAAFAVAQGLRADIKAYASLNERLSNATGLLKVTQDALIKISDTLGDARSIILKLGDHSLVGDQRTQYNNDYAALKVEVTNFINQASFNGVNLLTNGAVTNIIFDTNGGSFAILGQNTISPVPTAFATLANATDAINALSPSGGPFTTLETSVSRSLATIGNYIRSVSNQQSFISTLSDATIIGIGNIVDADLTKESSRLQSYQIKQQLGLQALSIANQAPSILIELFRN